MSKVGIIIARFQTPFLHEGHIALIKHALEGNDRVIIFLGTTQARLTKNNPLSFEARVRMVIETFSGKPIRVCPLPDCKSNEEWTTNLDIQIRSFTDTGDNVILYGSRDSFLSSYSGVFRTEYIEPVQNVSATHLRTGKQHFVDDTEEWRSGVMWASAHRYPVSFQTVDIAILNDKNEVLLGKKAGENKLRFIGGFVDPKDSSLEAAAKREVGEECGGIETDGYTYIGSYRIDDWRYRNEGDKILTAFFICKHIYGQAKAGDDIDGVQWLPLQDLTIELIEYEHQILFNALNEHLSRKELL